MNAAEIQQSQGAPAPWQERIVPGRFDGKTMIVTGAGSGIGRATALRIAREGGRVVVADIHQTRLDEVVAEHPDLALIPVAGDASNEDDIARMVAACDGIIHGLVNNAGIMDDFLPAHEVTDAVWERVMRVNVDSVMRLTRAVLPAFLAQGGGAIVNVTSEAGLRGSCAGVAYTASKHALVGITKHTAFMYGPSGVRANAVAPGGVMTNIEATFGSQFAMQRMAPIFQTSAGTPASSEQIAAAITYLLSDDSANINGAILPSDGGWSAL
jgi:NAD(P)-dependent dehydrogenase (short-subunit alcohol dehydrogenase family)